MNALASPYRFADTPLMTRERALEQELASTRYMLDALANEEVRVARCVRLKQAPQSDLDGLRDTLLMHLANEERLSHELVAVRAEIVARGERKVVNGTRRTALSMGSRPFSRSRDASSACSSSCCSSSPP